MAAAGTCCPSVLWALRPQTCVSDKAEPVTEALLFEDGPQGQAEGQRGAEESFVLVLGHSAQTWSS